MRERTRNVIVGVFTAGGLLAGAGLLFFFGELEPVFKRGWTLKVALNDAGGLRKGSLVTLNGVPVGSVERVEIWDDRTEPVLVTGTIGKGTEIPVPSVASVQASLLGSGARLELTSALPLRDPPERYPADGTTVLRGRVDAFEERILRELETRVDPIVKSFGELGELSRNLNDLVKPGADGAPPDPESLRTAMRRLNEVLARAEAAVASAETAFSSAETAFAGATKWLDDEQLRTDVRDAAANASVLMRDASMAASRIGALADSLAADATTLRDGALPVLDRAGKALEELDRLLIAARTGDGTVGRLLKDPALFEGLTDAAQRLDAALEKVNLLLDKIRAEGLGVELK